MYVVHFFDNRNLLLNQLRNQIPSEGEDVTIKGRKGKVTSVSCIDEKNVHVQVTLEVVKKSPLVLDNSKKKKR
jgi:hypothetical protein